MAKLLYQGHGSYRVVSKDGLVIYVDPYAGVGYDLRADIVLVTHEHADHNDLSLINKKRDCRILRAADMLVDGKYRKLEINGVIIEAVPAYNENHKRDCCVGYIITIDGMRIVFDGGFALVRQSNTEPVFTLRFEAKTQEECERFEKVMVTKIEEFVNNCKQN